LLGAHGNLPTDMPLNLSSTDPVTKPKRCHRGLLVADDYLSVENFSPRLHLVHPCRDSFQAIWRWIFLTSKVRVASLRGVFTWEEFSNHRNILSVTDRHCEVLQNRTLGERALLFSNNTALPRSVCIKGSDTKALNKANVVKSVNWVDRLSTDWRRYHSTRLLTLGITEYFCIYYRCRSKNPVMENLIDLSIRCLRY
jgi:hypothetical protein